MTDGRWQDLNLTRHTVDIVVTDATSSLATHLEFITALQSSDAPPKFIVIIDGNNPRAIEKLIEIKVQAILTPDDVSESLVSAVQQVAAGSCFVSYNTLSENVRRSTRGFCSRDMGEPLTLDELRIMRLVADGLTNREIAEREFMSEPTVKRRTQEIYRKLGARDRAHAAALAARLDIL